MDIDQLVGSRIKAWRESRGLSQPELVKRLGGEAAGYSPEKLSRLERGAQSVRIGQWLELALALEVPPAALVTPLETPDVSIELGDDIPPLQIWMSFQWLAGMGSPGTTARTYPRTFEGAMPHRQGSAAERYRQYLRFFVLEEAYMERWQERDRLRNWTDHAPPSLEPPPEDELQERLRQLTAEMCRAGDQLVKAATSLHRLGIPVPGLPEAPLLDLAACAEVERTDLPGWLNETGLTIFDPEDTDE